MSRKENDSIAELIGRIAGRIIIAALLVLAIFVTARYAFRFGESIFYQKPVDPAPGRDVTFTVEEGDTAETVSRRLKEMGVIAEAFPYKIQSDLYKTEYVPGDYEINTSMTPRQIISVFGAAEKEGD